AAFTWYLDAYVERRGLFPNDAVVYRTQPCSEAFTYFGNGSGGGGGGCSRVSRSAHPNHPNWIAMSSGMDGRTPLVEYDGVLSTRVARVEVRPTGARAFDVTILR